MQPKALGITKWNYTVASKKEPWEGQKEGSHDHVRVGGCWFLLLHCLNDPSSLL